VTVSEINAVVSERHIDASPETVFAFLVDPERMVRWMGTRAELDARPGGTLAIDVTGTARARGEFVEVVPPARVVFTFGWEGDPTVPPGSSTVEITLTPDAAGTSVRLVHRGITTAEMREQHSLGWNHYMARLAVVGAGGDPGPDPNLAVRQTRLDNESAAYVAAREELRLAEIELMRQRERVAALRRALPPGAEVADYVFAEGPTDLDAGDGPVRQVRLSELFSGPDRPLVIYQLMYGKLQTTPCPMCTLWIDGFNGVGHHLDQNVDFAVAAAADLPALRAYARSRGWRNLRLLSCGDSTFKLDMNSEDAEGNQDSAISVFSRDAAGAVRHVYTAHPRMDPDIAERGIDLLNPVWHVMDLTPQGRGDWYAELSYE
jgi:predicted dithiol-disulfide oxidoreductase (DUF899 family)/uncharacterized protein YndB with AHSA1/START domain